MERLLIMETFLVAMHEQACHDASRGVLSR
jgi:hypothetical protein